MVTLANTAYPDEMPHFIRVCTVCLEKIHLQRKKFNIFLKIITCGPSVYTMDHPDFIVCSFMEKSIDLQRKKFKIFLEIITCGLSIYTMDHSDFIVCSFMAYSIDLKRFNVNSTGV